MEIMELGKVWKEKYQFKSSPIGNFLCGFFILVLTFVE